MSHTPGGSVRARDSGAVKDDGDASAMQRHVHEELIEGAVEEGRVQGDDGVGALVRHAGRRRDGLGLRDAHVDDAPREGLVHGAQADGLHHGGGDAHDVIAYPRLGADFVGEHTRPPEAFGGDRQARLRVNRANGVEAVRDILFRGLVAAPLLGDHVDDDGFVERPCPTQRRLDRGDVVPVDGTDVLQAQILEHDLRHERILDAGLEPVERVVSGPTGGAVAEEVLLAPGEGLLVSGGSTQRIQVFREAADGRGVGAAIVVDDDDDATVLGGRNVVEGLPSQAARESAVADDADRPRALPAAVLLAGDAIHPREGGRGVGGLHNVMLRLGA